MLFDDDNKFVDLFVENIMWGNITIDWKAIDLDSEKELGKLGNLSSLFGQYIVAIKNQEERDLEELIPLLAYRLQAERIFGTIKGELRDRDHEKKLEEYKQDNEKLANTVAEQQEKIDEFIGKAVDTKNIRGIE